MKRLILKWLGLTKEIKDLQTELFILQQRYNSLENYVEHQMDEVSKYATMDADIGYRGDHTIIVTGYLNGRGYVDFFDVPNDEWTHLTNMLRDKRKLNRTRHIDAPPAFRQHFEV